jgi:hypothetical protein
MRHHDVVLIMPTLPAHHTMVESVEVLLLSAENGPALASTQ